MNTLCAALIFALVGWQEGASFRIDPPGPHVWGGETVTVRGELFGVSAGTEQTVRAVLHRDGQVLQETEQNLGARAGDTAYALQLVLPDIKRRLPAELRVSWKSLSREFPLVLFPRGGVRDLKELTERKRIGIIDDDGTLAVYLDLRRVVFQSLPNRLAQRAFRGDLIIVNRRDLGGKRDSLTGLLEEHARRGMRVLFIEPQRVSRDFRNGLAPSAVGADSAIFSDTQQTLLTGLGPDYFSNWRPRGAVAAGGFTVPVEGNARVRAFVDSDVASALILEILLGRGKFVFSAFDSGLSGGDPAAALYIDNLIPDLLDDEPSDWRPLSILADTGPEAAPDFLSLLGIFGDTNPDVNRSHPLWLIDGRGEFLRRYELEKPRFWKSFLARAQERGETVILLNPDPDGWSRIEPHLKDVSIDVAIDPVTPPADSRPLTHPASWLIRGLGADRLRRYLAQFPDDLIRPLTAAKLPAGGWIGGNGRFAFLPQEKMELYLLQFNFASEPTDTARRFWVELLTGWQVEVTPSEQSKKW